MKDLEVEMPSGSPDRKVYVGSYGFCRDKEGCLLLTRISKGPDAGRWTLPGGGILWGEDPDQAVFREMEEETGLTELKILSVAAIYSHTYRGSGDNPLPPLHHIGIIYTMWTRNFQLRSETGGTTDLCQWLSEEQARALPLTPLAAFGVELAWSKVEDGNYAQ